MVHHQMINSLNHYHQYQSNHHIQFINTNPMIIKSSLIPFHTYLLYDQLNKIAIVW